jgi:UDP-glucuronate 4-epimerase
MRIDYQEIDKNKKILITGAAGFIGFFLSKKLLEKGVKIID